MTLEEIATMLRTADRCGSSVDNLEGSRYVVISDTLALLMAEAIEKEMTHARI